MHQGEMTEREALEMFRTRMSQIESEVRDIDRELARRDIITLAHRARAAIRLTRTLLDRNVDILFAGHPPQIHTDLYNHLDWAEAHVAKALAEEVDFQAMEKRIFLAVRLAEDVLSHVAGALTEMERRLDERDRAELEDRY